MSIRKVAKKIQTAGKAVKNFFCKKKKKVVNENPPIIPDTSVVVNENAQLKEKNDLLTKQLTFYKTQTKLLSEKLKEATAICLEHHQKQTVNDLQVDAGETATATSSSNFQEERQSVVLPRKENIYQATELEANSRHQEVVEATTNVREYERALSGVQQEVTAYQNVLAQTQVNSILIE